MKVIRESVRECFEAWYWILKSPFRWKYPETQYKKDDEDES